MVSSKLTTPSPRRTFFRSFPDAFRGSFSVVMSTNAGTLKFASPSATHCLMLGVVSDDPASIWTVALTSSPSSSCGTP